MDTQDEGLALEMGVQVSRPRRFFPPEYKAEVIELIRSTGKTVGQVARELDLTETAVRQWVRQADLDAGHRRVGAKVGLTSRAVQESFGVFQPDFGVLLDDMFVDEAALPRGSAMLAGCALRFLERGFD